MALIPHSIRFHRHTALAAFTLLCLALIWPACRRAAPPPVSRADRMRIVCLSPALTDVLLALGLGDRIVGRDSYEEQLAEDVPRVGDLMSVNLEAVLALRPTDVVLQSAKAGAPPRIEAIAQQQGWRFINLQIDTLSDVRHAVERLVNDLSFAGDDAILRPEIEDQADRLLAEMDLALAPMPAEVRERLGPIMLLYFTDPPAAFGPGSYLSDMLAALGGRNAVTGGAWQELDLERVAAGKPWAIIAIKPGLNDAATARPEESLGSVGRLDLECVRAGRVALLRHPQALLPGASLIEVAGELRSIMEALASPLESADQ